jgi:hypothetical protein
MGTTYQPGVAPVAQPQGSPTRNSTLKACHIANAKDGFHRKATENSQLSIGDRLPLFRLNGCQMIENHHQDTKLQVRSFC